MSLRLLGLFTLMLWTSTTVVECLLTVDDDMLYFSEESDMSGSIQEGCPIGTSVAQLVVAGDYRKALWKFKILAGDAPLRKFAFNRDKIGLLEVIRLIDRDKPAFDASTYNLTIMAKDRMMADRSMTTTIYITVMEVNDNSPKFEHQNYTFSIDEEGQIVKLIGQVKATDDDLDDSTTPVSYSISGAQASIFNIDERYGSIRTTQTLDYEEGMMHTVFEVVAMDNGGRKATATVTLNIENINDHDPVCKHSEESIYVPENERIGTKLHTVSCSDDDPPDTLKYKVAEITNETKFRIDEETGIIYLLKGLDFETKTEYDLEIEVTDNGDPPRSTSTNINVNIEDINEFTPAFSDGVSSASISETSPVGTSVLTVQASDKDGSAHEMRYLVTSGDGRKQFLLNEFTGVLTVDGELDAEIEDTYELLIIAADEYVISGHSRISKTVKITIIDENDNAPVFTESSFSCILVVGTGPGKTVCCVRALDADHPKSPNGQLAFSIIGGNRKKIFEFDGSCLRVKKHKKLKQGRLRLQVQVQDKGTEPLDGTATVNIDVKQKSPTVKNKGHAHVPRFVHSIYYIVINENSKKSLIQKVVAISDKYQQPLTYSILSGNDDHMFVLGKKNGFLRRRKTLDYEKVNSYTIVVQAKDKFDKTAETIVNIKLVDLNDNKPIFESKTYSVELMENVPVGTSIITILATDKDSGANNYGTIVYTCPHNYFAIDPTNGLMTTLTNIDREEKNRFIVKVMAGDRQGTGRNIVTATVVIQIQDENDNVPEIIGLYHGSVVESAPIGTVVFTIVAKDEDTGENGEFTFAFDKGDIDTFDVDSTTGIVTLRSLLDMENRQTYQARVEVMDKGFPTLTSSTYVTFAVMDVNDNAPNFEKKSYTFEIVENSFKAFEVGSVHASDSDFGNNRVVTYYLEKSIEGDMEDFAIDPESGRITVNRKVDREARDKYVFMVAAHDQADNPLYDYVNVTVKILDINDNRPNFYPSEQVAGVTPAFTIGTVIVQFYNVDNDLGSNGQFSIYMENITPEEMRVRQYFLLSSQTNSLTLKSFLPPNTASFNFKVFAKDKGTPAKVASCDVTIHLIDGNTNPPVFEKEFYSFEAANQGICNTEIEAIKAVDPDESLNGEVLYILKSNLLLFGIHNDTGMLYVKSPADIDNNTLYLMEVEAQDKGIPVMNAVKTASIRIDTFNPNNISISLWLGIHVEQFPQERETLVNALEHRIRRVYKAAVVKIWCIERIKIWKIVFMYVHLYCLINGDALSSTTSPKQFMPAQELLSFCKSVIGTGGLPSLVIIYSYTYSKHLSSIDEFFVHPPAPDTFLTGSMMSIPAAIGILCVLCWTCRERNYWNSDWSSFGSFGSLGSLSDLDDATDPADASARRKKKKKRKKKRAAKKFKKRRRNFDGSRRKKKKSRRGSKSKRDGSHRSKSKKKKKKKHKKRKLKEVAVEVAEEVAEERKEKEEDRKEREEEEKEEDEEE